MASEEICSTVLLGLADIGDVPVIPTDKNIHLVYGGKGNMPQTLVST